MHRCLAALVAVSASAAFAQDEHEEETTVTVPGVQVKVRTPQVGPRPAAPGPAPAPAAGRTQPPPRAFGGENFSIDYQAIGGGVPSGTIKVASPEGATAEVWNEDGTLAGSFSVPFNFSSRTGAYYRFIIVGPDGQLLLDKKIENRQFLGCLVRQRGAAPASAPAAAPQAAAAQGMPEADFEALVSAVEEVSFGHEKLGVVESAAKSNVFTIAQVGRLVELMGASEEKVGVVERTRAKIVDRQNAFKLLEKFSFSADKEKVRKLLK